MSPADKKRRVEVAILVAVIGLAAVLRAWLLFAVRNGLWEDEAGLALNIVPRPFLDVGRPFLFRQMCPFGFMYAVKLVTGVLGPTDYALRSVSLLAGLAVVPLVAALAHRLYGLRTAILATAFAAFAPRLAWYSTELKPYIVDAAAAATLLWLGLRALDRPAPGRSWRTLALAGIAAVWLSLPAVFVLGGLGVALATRADLRSRRTLAALGAMAAAWLGSAGVHLGLLTAGADVHGQTEFMTTMWHGYFAPFPPDSVADLRWYGGKFVSAFEDPGGFGSLRHWLDPGAGRGMVRPWVEPPIRYVAAAFFAVGAVALLRAHRPFLLAVSAQLVLVLAASAMQRYPIQGRMLMFAAPALLVITAGGAVQLLAQRPRAIRIAGALALVALAYYPLMNVAGLMTHKVGDRDFHDVMADLMAGYRPGDVVYVDHTLRWPLAHYAAVMGLQANIVEGRRYPAPEVYVLGGPAKILDELAVVERAPRAWVLLPTYVPDEGVSAETYVTTALRRTGELRGRWAGQDAVLYLYTPR